MRLNWCSKAKEKAGSTKAKPKEEREQEDPSLARQAARVKDVNRIPLVPMDNE